MSRQTSFLNSLREVPTGDKLKAEHTISLIDHTRPAEDPSSIEQGAERADSDATATPPTPANDRLIKRLTNNSLSLQQSVKKQISKQKYARYGQDRYGEENDDGTTNSSSALPPDDDTINGPQPGEPATSTQTSYLERSRAKALKLRKRKRTGLGRGKETADTVIDILYENQRGTFLFGIPRYSSSSLLPSDPKSWQNKDFRTSPVDIRNAQVPDPSWEWVWKNWYVDMSRDVDEEGWEYSMLFKAGMAWHGNHPWFHSFVRRRRWLRMRRRKEVLHVTNEKGHELTAEYFTIHPRDVKPAGSDEQSKGKTTEGARRRAKAEDEVPIDKMEISDIGSLVRALRKASVDREKLVAVRKFVAEGGDELVYLSQRMSDIMSLFLYQSSRRQLLADLIAHHDDAHELVADLMTHDDHNDDTDAQVKHDTALRHAENLHKAVEAAEEQVQRLEYWSDVKGMATEEEMLHPERLPGDVTNGGAGGRGHPVGAFASKQPSSAAPSKQSSTWFDAPDATSPPEGVAKTAMAVLGKSPGGESESDGSSLDRYITAAESVAESEKSVGGRSGKSGKSGRGGGGGVLSPAQQGREKAVKLGGWDGVMDEEGEERGDEHSGDSGQEMVEGEEGDERDEGEGPLIDTTDRNGVDSVVLQPVGDGPGDVVEEEN